MITYTTTSGMELQVRTLTYSDGSGTIAIICDGETGEELATLWKRWSKPEDALSHGIWWINQAFK